MTEEATKKRGRPRKQPETGATQAAPSEEVQTPFIVPTPVGNLETTVSVDGNKLFVMTHLTAARLNKLNMLELPQNNIDALSKMADAIIESSTSK